MEPIRINKYFSQIGYCSRRKADALIEEGKVYINGKPASPGSKVTDLDEIRVEGTLIVKGVTGVRPVWLAFNKPKGVVCSEDGQGCITVWEYLGIKEHLFTVGRLDKDSEGLILITNQGDVADELSRARNYHEKEYVVSIDRPVTDAFIKKMSSGVEILDTVTRDCEVKRLSKYSFSIVLTQGINRQIRRMCEACGARVVSLRRVRFNNVLLGELEMGKTRELTGQEIDELNK